ATLRVRADPVSGGSDNDYRHGPSDDSPRSADPRPPRNARAPATQFDSSARPHVSRVSRGESFARRTPPRGGARRGGDGASPRAAGGRTKTRPGRGPRP